MTNDSSFRQQKLKMQQHVLKLECGGLVGSMEKLSGNSDTPTPTGAARNPFLHYRCRSTYWKKKTKSYSVRTRGARKIERLRTLIHYLWLIRKQIELKMMILHQEPKFLPYVFLKVDKDPRKLEGHPRKKPLNSLNSNTSQTSYHYKDNRLATGQAGLELHTLFLLQKFDVICLLLVVLLKLTLLRTTRKTLLNYVHKCVHSKGAKVLRA
ncbi:hypothetical protein J6590_056907 [Homalodisca vitripennis]|nr:hypothetical protein J6590_056907 [Homalodisca vitripennis]